MLKGVFSMNETIDAILMASGLSTRFGEKNKLIQPFKGIPLAQHTLNLVCNSKLYNTVYFITATQEVEALAQNYSVKCIHNKNPELGQSESIRLGVAHSNADYYHFFTCDQPFLTHAILEEIIKAKKVNHIVQCVAQNKPASPILFSNTFKPNLLALTKDETGRIIKKQYPEAVISVPIENSLLLQDIDTPEEFKKLENVNIHKNNMV